MRISLRSLLFMLGERSHCFREIQMFKTRFATTLILACLPATTFAHAPLLYAGASAVQLASAEHVHQDTEVAAEFAPVKIGDLELTDAYAKAMTPGQPVGAVYLTIANNGKDDDHLVSVESSAGVVELHEMSLNGDVMTMRKLAKGIPLPAAKTVELKPGGLHLMFMGVKKPFTVGQKVKATFTFEKAGSVEVEIPVFDIKGGMGHKM